VLDAGDNQLGLQPVLVYFDTNVILSAADLEVSGGTIHSVVPRGFNPASADQMSTQWAVFVEPNQGATISSSSVEVSPSSALFDNWQQEDNWIPSVFGPETRMDFWTVTAEADGNIVVGSQDGSDHAIALFDEEGRIVNFRGGSLTIGNVQEGDQFRIGVALHGDSYSNPFPTSATYKLNEDGDPFTLSGQEEIDDGGDDAYDGGNILSTDGVNLPYLSDTQTGVFGENSEHLMVYRDGVFGTLVTGNTKQDFKVSGNLGADGDGVEDLIVLSEHNGYSAVTQRTFFADGDPSINRIFVYESNSDVQIKPLDGNTNNDDFEISGLNGVDTFAYFAVYGQPDAPFNQESLQTFF